MAEQTIISWNMTNWVTILVMAALGFFIVGLGAQVIAKYKAGNSDSGSASA